MVKRHLITAFAVLALGLPAAAQQKPATAVEKAEAEIQKRNAAAAAAQAEEVARAQQRVAEEARRKEEQRIRAIEARESEIIPIDVEVVVSRYQGDKRVSSLPYFLAVNASQRPEKTSLRMGANVPVPMTVFTPVQGGADKPSPITSYNYQDISTNIDCEARPLGDGRFVVSIQVGEKSIVESTGTPGAVKGAPVIRNFNASNNLVLRDGLTLKLAK